MGTLGIVLAAILGFIVLYIVMSVVWGLVLTQLWAWFVVPTFDLPQIGFVEAIGLSLVVTMFTYRYSRDNEAEHVVAGFIAPVVSLAFGWFWQMFL